MTSTIYQNDVKAKQKNAETYGKGTGIYSKLSSIRLRNREQKYPRTPVNY